MTYLMRSASGTVPSFVLKSSLIHATVISKTGLGRVCDGPEERRSANVRAHDRHEHHVGFVAERTYEGSQIRLARGAADREAAVIEAIQPASVSGSTVGTSRKQSVMTVCQDARVGSRAPDGGVAMVAQRLDAVGSTSVSFAGTEAPTGLRVVRRTDSPRRRRLTPSAAAEMPIRSAATRSLNTIALRLLTTRYWHRRGFKAPWHFLAHCLQKSQRASQRNLRDG